MAISQQYGLPPGLLASLCYVESTHNIYAVHHDDGGSDSLGVCQIKLATAQWLGFQGTEQELMAPITNITYAAKYLHHLETRYHGDTELAVIAYNMGSARALRHTNYSDKVMAVWRNEQ